MKSESGSKINNKQVATNDDNEAPDHWSHVRVRRTGTLALLSAAVLAGYAVVGGVLRSTVIHLARSSSEQKLLETANVPVAACTMYWLFFALSILLALYMAALEVRTIRSRYRAQRRDLVMQASREAYIHGARERKDCPDD